LLFLGSCIQNIIVFPRKRNPTSSCVPQIDELSSLVSSINSDEPILLVSFEQKVQIPILPKHDQSCKLVENETYGPTPTVSSMPSEKRAKIHTWVINRYKVLNCHLSFTIYLPKFSNMFLNSMEKIMFQWKSTWNP